MKPPSAKTLRSFFASLLGALAALGSDWYAFTQDLDLAPGRHQARVVVRDKNSGRVGSVTHAFEVAAPGAFRLSPPVLSDALHQGESGGPHPVTVLRRAFRGDGVLYCEYQAYGAARENRDGPPRVTAGFEVRRADGTAVIDQARTLGLDRRPIAPLRAALGTTATDLTQRYRIGSRQAIEVTLEPRGARWIVVDLRETTLAIE